MLEPSTQNGIAFELHGLVAVIAFNRPERRNAIDLEMRQEYARVLALAMADEDVRAIVITGRGGHFCAGGDIGSMRKAEGISGEAGRKRMRKSLLNSMALYACDKPVIAAVEGCAYGGGFGLALLADMVIASDSARFCMSFARVGLVPDNCSLFTLPRAVGLQRAKALMFSARDIDAQQALQWGIAMEVVPQGQAEARALALAASMTQASATAIAMTKAALNNSLSTDLRAMVEVEANAQGVAYTTDYHRQAIERFLNKQAPLFQWPASTPQP